MDTNKPDAYDSIGLGDPDKESIFVLRDIEDDSAVFKNAGMSEVLLSLCRCMPVGKSQ